MTERQRRFLEAIAAAKADGGKVARRIVMDPSGWFFPIDISLGSGPIAAQLYRQGKLERQDVGAFSTRYMYREKVSP